MSRSDHSSSGQARHERHAFSRKQASRQELDKFFAQCLAFVSQRACRERRAAVMSDGIASFAFRKFGALAPNVMQHWGIDSPEALEQSFYQYLRACGSRGARRTPGFAQSEALKALFRGDFWP